MNREQWIELWNHVCNIEHAAGFLKSPPTKQTILWEVKQIKDLLQIEMGQME